MLPHLWPQLSLRQSFPTDSKKNVRSVFMISPETRVQIRRYFYAEHWTVGTIATQLGLHPDTVRNAIESERFHKSALVRVSLTDPYLDFIRQTLDQYPRLRATRIYQMIRDRGFNGSIAQLRRAVAHIRPAAREPFLRLQTFPAEQAQADWATARRNCAILPLNPRSRII